MANSIKAESRISIKASPEEVFKYICTLKYHYLWNPALRTLSTEDKLSQGMSYSTESVYLGDIKVITRNKVTKLVPNQQIVLKNEFGVIQFETYFTLHREGDRTIVSSTVDMLTTPKSFGLTLPVLKRLANKELQSDLKFLKAAVETNLASNA